MLHWLGCLFTMALVAVGCTPPMQVGLRPMLSEAADNRFALLLKYGAERVQISGEVSVISLHKQGEVQHQFTPTGATSKRSHKNMPYVYLVPSDGANGRALCFFPENDYAAAARVSKGASLTLECTFQEYVTKANDQVLVFNSCEIR